MVNPLRIANLGPVKKLVPFFFLLLLLTQLVGYYVYFGFRLYTIHEESREALRQLPDHKLQQLRFTHDQFQAFGDDGYHEFEWNDRMYDVARVETSGNEVLVYALPDEAEDDLLSFLEAVTENVSKDHQPTPGSFVSFFMLSFLRADATIIPDQETIRLTHQTSLCTGYTGPALECADRPPLAGIFKA